CRCWSTTSTRRSSTGRPRSTIACARPSTHRCGFPSAQWACSPFTRTGGGEHLGVAVAFALMEERATRIAILDERDRHARDLHDGIHQVLSSLRIYALEARKALRTRDTKEAISLLGELTR